MPNAKIATSIRLTEQEQERYRILSSLQGVPFSEWAREALKEKADQQQENVIEKLNEFLRIETDKTIVEVE